MARPRSTVLWQKDNFYCQNCRKHTKKEPIILFDQFVGELKVCSDNCYQELSKKRGGE